jgi:glycosyltransferase involved in cell wall biosynthesis
MIRRVHLVYPHGPSPRCPHTIGRHLAQHLRERYDVVLHDWDDDSVLEPEPGDALVGHPHPFPATIFRRSARRSGWERVLAMFPFNHANGAEQVAYADAAVRRSDLILAICGKYWLDGVDVSPVAAWKPKLVHLDLAIDREEVSPVKTAFAPPGRRRLLYIGHVHWTKNPRYLEQIAAELADVEFGWIGEGDALRGLRGYGSVDFRDPAALQIVAQHDILVTVGRADSNPCTVLEAMAWGLVPVCTPQSGYLETDGVVHVPLDDASAAAAVLRRLLDAPVDQLERLRDANWERLDAHFNWTRFAGQVIDALESSESPAIGHDGRTRLLVRSLTSRYSPLRPHNLRLLLR